MTVQNNTDLLLKFLSNISEAMYSKLLYKKFTKLLQMNLKSFHIYLSGCKFQTVQMKSMKYLPIRSSTNTQIVAHHSCILGRSFIERYTIKGQELKELRQRQKKIFLKESSYLREQKRLHSIHKKRKRLNSKKNLIKKLTLVKRITSTKYRKSHSKTRKEEKNYDTKSEPSRDNKSKNENKDNNIIPLREKDSANYESSTSDFEPAHRRNFFSFLRLGSLQHDKQKIAKQKEEMRIK